MSFISTLIFLFMGSWCGDDLVIIVEQEQRTTEDQQAINIFIVIPVNLNSNPIAQASPHQDERKKKLRIIKSFFST